MRYHRLWSRDPIGQMRTIYDQLELGEFSQVQPKLAAYFEDTRDYQTNRHRLDPETRDRIQRRWQQGPYMQPLHGYCENSAAASQQGS